MKKLLAIALTLTAATAFATEGVSTHKFCKDISGSAEISMKARQAGISVVWQMETLDDAARVANEIVDEVMGRDRDRDMDRDMARHSMIKETIIDAYKKPRYSSEEYQRRAISDFRDEWYVRCLKVREM